MAKRSERFYGRKPTGLYLSYAVRLLGRLAVLGYAIFVFCTHPERLHFTEYFGWAHGFNTVDFVFLTLLADILTKLIPSAKISMGSLKQYKRFHVPTAPMLKGGREELAAMAREALDQGIISLRSTPALMGRALQETYDGAMDALRQLLRSIDVLRMLPFTESQRSASEEVRAAIRRKRVREVVPVVIFWVAFNGAVAAVLNALGLLVQPVLLLWTLFFYVFDMVCVVLWCPLQLLFMKNRCCTTCSIFNWDAIMTVTPLIMAPCWFSGILIALAAVVLTRWELAFLRHPERFDESTNASLSCALCKDKLCYLRNPLEAALLNLPSPDLDPGDPRRTGSGAAGSGCLASDAGDDGVREGA